jgi:rSAM/selenodomain-associated transferase 1
LSRGWLVVFAKAPRPGLVKTRMSPPLSLEDCAELYAEMLVDVLRASARFAEDLGLEKVLAFHPPEAPAELVPRAPAGFRLQAQQGADLGERMAHACREAAAAGAERILIRGSDSPALSARVMEQAMARLDAGDDVVLTPDQGGGYALIGLRRAQPRVFALTMSTRTVLQETLTRASSLGLSATTTDPTFDLDHVRDFQPFLEWAQADGGAEFADLCPRTVQYVSRLYASGVL